MKRLIILVLALFPLTAALADKPDFLPEKYSRVMPWGPMPFLDCTGFDGMDFWVWAEGVTIDEGKQFFDKDGTPTKTVSAYYMTDVLQWVPESPACNTPPFSPVTCPDPWTQMPGTATITSDSNHGKGDHQQAIYRDWILIDPDGIPDTEDEYWYPTWGQLSGVNFHIVIPGYGSIFALAGHLTHRLNPETGEWDMISMTPNWENWKTEDIFAMCSYHANQ
jgi:hypothetical protein